jgi:hypothetical protein
VGREWKPRVTGLGIMLWCAASIVFLLVAFGVTVGNATTLEELSLGLGLLALGHVVP